MKYQSKHKNYNKGFSIIELLVYIAIVGLFITGAVIFTWDVLYGREKSYKQQIVEQNARIAILKIENEIKKANNIQSVSNNQLILDNVSYTTTINISNGVLQITSNGKGPYNLTSNQVKVLQQPDVTEPLFKNLSNSNNGTKNIALHFTVVQNQTGIPQSMQAQTTIKSSVELNGKFSQARSLLINGTNVKFTNTFTDLINLSMGNSGVNSLIIKGITISWSGNSTTASLTQIQFNGTTVWTGTASSGSTIPIANYTIPTGSSTIPINYFRFNADMAGSMINMTFIMGDNSLARIVVDFTGQ